MNLVFEKGFEKEIAKADVRTRIKIKELIEDIILHPFEGIGKPEPLKYEFSGCWSRRIDKKNRLIYSINNDDLIILSCEGHYN